MSTATVRVRVLRATNLKDMDKGLGGASDPFVVLTLAGQTKQTTVKNNTSNPVWNEDVVFQVPTRQGAVRDRLQVQVWDKDVAGRDELGRGFVDLSALRRGLVKEEVLPLAEMGRLYLELELQGGTDPTSPTSMGGMQQNPTMMMPHALDGGTVGQPTATGANPYGAPLSPMGTLPSPAPVRPTSPMSSPPPTPGFASHTLQPQLLQPFPQSPGTQRPISPTSAGFGSPQSTQYAHPSSGQYAPVHSGVVADNGSYISYNNGLTPVTHSQPGYGSIQQQQLPQSFPGTMSYPDPVPSLHMSHVQQQQQPQYTFQPIAPTAPYSHPSASAYGNGSHVLAAEAASNAAATVAEAAFQAAENIVMQHGRAPMRSTSPAFGRSASPVPMLMPASFPTADDPRLHIQQEREAITRRLQQLAEAERQLAPQYGPPYSGGGDGGYPAHPPHASAYGPPTTGPPRTAGISSPYRSRPDVSVEQLAYENWLLEQQNAAERQRLDALAASLAERQRRLSELDSRTAYAHAAPPPPGAYDDPGHRFTPPPQSHNNIYHGGRFASPNRAMSPPNHYGVHHHQQQQRAPSPTTQVEYRRYVHSQY